MAKPNVSFAPRARGKLDFTDIEVKSINRHQVYARPNLYLSGGDAARIAVGDARKSLGFVAKRGQDERMAAARWRWC
jgi:hypothetical protein